MLWLCYVYIKAHLLIKSLLTNILIVGNCSCTNQHDSTLAVTSVKSDGTQQVWPIPRAKSSQVVDNVRHHPVPHLSCAVTPHSCVSGPQFALSEPPLHSICSISMPPLSSAAFYSSIYQSLPQTSSERSIAFH